MKIYGVDFTSTPTAAKPITVARCEVAEDGGLDVLDLARIASFDAFERGLAQPGPWVAGMDFPFALPRRLVANLGWPARWEEVVERVARLERQELVDLLDLYRAARPAGDKEHRRDTDLRAGALSPMKVYGTPLAKMFQEGAPRLAATPLNLPPVRPTGDDRTVVEAYPGLVLRNLLGGRRSYKSDDRRKQTAKLENARRDAVVALTGEPCRATYGFAVRLNRFCGDALVEDAGGDLLDAVLAAVQAAWAFRQEEGWGVPGDCDPLEGWIVDPTVLSTDG